MPLLNRSRLVVSVFAFLAASVTAHAGTIDYTLTGSDGPGSGGIKTFTFSLPQNPIPTSIMAGVYFYISNVPSVANGTPDSARILFELQPNPTGFYAFNYLDNFVDIYGGSTQLFTGPISAPTLSTGSWTFARPNVVGSSYTLTAVDESASVTPEPSSIILLGTGVLGVAGALRRRISGSKS